jgi:hypothetical protein
MPLPVTMIVVLPQMMVLVCMLNVMMVVVLILKVNVHPMLSRDALLIVRATLMKMQIQMMGLVTLVAVIKIQASVIY